MNNSAVSLTGVGAVLGGKPVLKNIDLEIQRGENWVIVGPNGSGKTTLLKVINGYQRISGGEATILDERFGETDLRDLRKKISMVSSYLADLVLLDDNVLDIVVSGGYAQTRLWSIPEAEKVDRARTLLRRLGCSRYEDRILKDLSQGERQKVIIARALMSHAELLTLDEPCAGLDLKARESFLSSLEKIARGHSLSIIYVTHRIDEIPGGFDHALLLRKGTIIAKGKIGKVLTSSNISRCFEVKVEVKKWRGRFYPIIA
ncbi:MAG: ABC transporter ATP-binding protein [Nitrososphaerales archaeon]